MQGWGAVRVEWQDEDCRHWVRGLSGRGRKVPGDPAGATPPMPRVPFGSAGSSEVVSTHLLPGPQTGWAKWRILPSRPPSDWHLLRRGGRGPLPLLQGPPPSPSWRRAEAPPKGTPSRTRTLIPHLNLLPPQHPGLHTRPNRETITDSCPSPSPGNRLGNRLC